MNEGSSLCLMCDTHQPVRVTSSSTKAISAERLSTTTTETEPTSETPTETKVQTLVEISGAQVRHVLRRLSTITSLSSSVNASHDSASPISIQPAHNSSLQFEEPVLPLDVDESVVEDEVSHVARLHKVSVAISEFSPLIMPLSKIIACYLEDIVILISSKDKEDGQFTVYAPYLKAHSSVMELKLNSMEPSYVIECSLTVLREVVRYVASHKTKQPPVIEKPLRSSVMKNVCVCQWDAWFIDSVAEDRQLLYDIILVSNALNIQGLLHLGCAKVASLIKGQPLERIREVLGAPAGSTASTAKASDRTTSITGSPEEVADNQPPKCMCEYH